jgi:hypothetical protein
MIDSFHTRNNRRKSFNRLEPCSYMTRSIQLGTCHLFSLFNSLTTRKTIVQLFDNMKKPKASALPSLPQCDGRCVQGLRTNSPSYGFHAQADKLFIPKGLYLLISCEEFNHR